MELENKFIIITNESLIKVITDKPKLRIERRGEIGRFSEYHIFIPSKEGVYCPHFHIVSNGGDIKSYIRIDKLEYFHENKQDFSKLNRKVLNDLYDFLTENNNEKWKQLIDEWNKHIDNEKFKINRNIPVLDYRKLNQND